VEIGRNFACCMLSIGEHKGATRGGEAKGAEAPPLVRSKLRKKIISFNF